MMVFNISLFEEIKRKIFFNSIGENVVESKYQKQKIKVR